jgi:hypothetical protein
MVSSAPITFAAPLTSSLAATQALADHGVLQAQLAKAQAMDTSQQPVDSSTLSDADRLAKEEEEAHKHLKSFYALGTVLDTTVRSLGNLGMTWGLIQGLMGHKLTGWTAVGAGAGAALKVADAAFMTKMAAVNRNEAAAVENSFDMVQGMGVLLTSLGLGRIPAFVSVAAVMGKGAYSMYRATQAQKAKDAAKQEDEARRAAEKAAAKPSELAKPAPSAVQAEVKVEASPMLTEVLRGTPYAAMRPMGLQPGSAF